MGDENTILGATHARHLLRRAGFGARATDVQAFAGLTRGVAADRLLSFKPAKFRPGGKDIWRRRVSWLKYMVRVRAPLQEKLVLFWHDHFATGNDKVQDHAWMADQNRLLRLHCKGNFKDFVKAINVDPAMMEYLDTFRNFKDQPNENYARELMELFTLGVHDLAGAPNYEQQDIVQIARAFSGWGWDYSRRRVAFRDWAHDYNSEYESERGPKVIFKSHGGFGPSGRDFTQPGGEGPQEISQVVDIIFEHRDSDGKSTVARFITGKLLEYFAHRLPPYPDNATIIDRIIQRSGFDTSWDLRRLVREIFVDDFFYETAAPPFTSTIPKSVVWPVDFVVTTLRLLKVSPRSDKWGNWYIEGGAYGNVTDYLAEMGQILFEPPSVFGWDWEEGWINSATLLARYSFARDVAMARGNKSYHLRPQLLMDLSLTAPSDIVDAVTNLLGIADQLTASERQTLIDYLGSGPLDLNDPGVRQKKLHGLFALALQAPHFHLH
jgi:uncharacterized protein (DUF1800 family)